jgi:hypothetical protein
LEELEHIHVPLVTVLSNIGREENDLFKHALLGAVGLAMDVKRVGVGLGVTPCPGQRDGREAVRHCRRAATAMAQSGAVCQKG